MSRRLLASHPLFDCLDGGADAKRWSYKQGLAPS